MQSSWTQWSNGNRSQNRAAKEMGLAYRKAPYQNGFNIKYYTSSNHIKANQKYTSRSNKEKLDNYCKELCDKWKKDESVSASQADINELNDIKRMLKDAKISKRPLVIIEEYIEHQNKLLQFADQEVKDSIKEYLDDRKDYGLTSDQLTAIERHLETVLEPWFGKTLRQIRAADLINRFKKLWNKNRASGNWKRATYDKYLTSVKALFKWGQTQEPSKVDPAFPLVKLKRKSGQDNTAQSYNINQIKYFSPDDTYKILKMSAGWDKQGRSYNWQPIMAMQFFGACRPSEAMLLQWSQFNWKDKTVTVGKRKTGGGIRFIEMKPNLVAMLQPYCQEADGKGGLLPEKLAGELYPLFYECQKQASQGEVQVATKEVFEKKFKSVRDSAGQACNKMARAANVDWIQDGPRHSFGTYRYRDLFDEIKGSDDARSNHAKEYLRMEMGTGIECLDKNYIAAGVEPKQVKEYFSIAA